MIILFSCKQKYFLHESFCTWPQVKMFVFFGNQKWPTWPRGSEEKFGSIPARGAAEAFKT